MIDKKNKDLVINSETKGIVKSVENITHDVSNIAKKNTERNLKERENTIMIDEGALNKESNHEKVEYAKFARENDTKRETRKGFFKIAWVSAILTGLWLILKNVPKILKNFKK